MQPAKAGKPDDAVIASGTAVGEPNLKGMVVAALGGDRRQVIICRRLLDLGAELRVVGIPPEEIGQCRVYASPPEALRGAQALLLPVPAMGDDGRLHAPMVSVPLYLKEEDLSLLEAGSPVLVGIGKPWLRQVTKRLGLHLIELMEDDEVAILNSIPSAEGAVQMAMEMLPITIHGCRAVIIGCGRTGFTLARLLQAMGARTVVVARNPVQRARAWTIGVEALPLEDLIHQAAAADVIFNTVPALIVTREILKVMRREAIVIDLASQPGGTDFAAAAELGIRAVLAPGLPGKVAPETAGRILADVVPRILASYRGSV